MICLRTRGGVLLTTSTLVPTLSLIAKCADNGGGPGTDGARVDEHHVRSA